MKKKEFLNELGKRFKYVGEIISNTYGFIGLKRYLIEIGVVDYNGNKIYLSKQVHRDTISFWVQNEGKANEKVLNVEWKGLDIGIDTEIISVLKGSGIYYETEQKKFEKKGIPSRILDEKKE